MIDRRGQTWEDRDGRLIYLVTKSEGYVDARSFYHHILILFADVDGHMAGETAYEFERTTQPWEETERRRIA